MEMANGVSEPGWGLEGQVTPWENGANELRVEEQAGLNLAKKTEAKEEVKSVGERDVMLVLLGKLPGHCRSWKFQEAGPQKREGLNKMIVGK